MSGTNCFGLPAGDGLPGFLPCRGSGRLQGSLDKAALTDHERCCDFHPCPEAEPAARLGEGGDCQQPFLQTCCPQRLCQSPQKPSWLLLFTGMFRTGFTREHPFWGSEHLPSNITPCHIPPCLAAAVEAANLILPSCPHPALPRAGERLGDLSSLQGFSFICGDTRGTDTVLVSLLLLLAPPADGRVFRDPLAVSVQQAEFHLLLPLPHAGCYSDSPHHPTPRSQPNWTF